MLINKQFSVDWIEIKELFLKQVTFQTFFNIKKKKVTLSIKFLFSNYLHNK